MMARNLVISAIVAAALSAKQSSALVTPKASSYFARSSSTSTLHFLSTGSVASANKRASLLYSAVTEEVDTVQVPDCDESDPECITTPRGATNDWEVHKFGGASLATADLYRTVGDLLIREAQGRGDGSIPTMV
jgi:hypothetical protein